jgi:hypothetical protein
MLWVSADHACAKICPTTHVPLVVCRRPFPESKRTRRVTPKHRRRRKQLSHVRGEVHVRHTSPTRTCEVELAPPAPAFSAAAAAPVAFLLVFGSIMVDDVILGSSTAAARSNGLFALNGPWKMSADPQ